MKNKNEVNRITCRVLTLQRKIIIELYEKGYLITAIHANVFTTEHADTGYLVSKLS